MDAGENVVSFTAITGASADQAQQYLEMSNNDLTQAMDLFYNLGGADLGQARAAAAQPLAQSSAALALGQEREVINLDSDEEEGTQPRAIDHGDQGPSRIMASEEDDAAMARRLQEEFYGSASGSGTAHTDSEGYRAPIAPTRETLVGPGSYDHGDDDEMHAAVLDQLHQRRSRLGRGRCSSLSNQ
jgi:hypothetical protein